MDDCNNLDRTHDSARECGCEACKKWWVENTPGYFLCPRCKQVCLTLAEQVGEICETCFNDEVEFE